MLMLTDVDKALILIAKNMGEEWVLKVPIPKLMSVVMEWRKGLVSECEAAFAIYILCKLTYNLQIFLLYLYQYINNLDYISFIPN